MIITLFILLSFMQFIPFSFIILDFIFRYYISTRCLSPARSPFNMCTLRNIINEIHMRGKLTVRILLGKYMRERGESDTGRGRTESASVFDKLDANEI